MTRALAKLDYAETQAALLATLAATDNLSAACRAVGVTRATVVAYAKANPPFAAAMDEALAIAADELESIIRDRAINGTLKRLWHRGEPVMDPATGEQAVEHEYNVTRELALLKASKPDKYRERSDIRVDAHVTMDAAQIVERINRITALQALDSEPPTDVEPRPLT